MRRLEENVDILLYQYLFPLYKYQVGTPDAPAREYKNGLTEIDVVTKEWSRLPPEGAIVIPERHDIEVLGAKGSALDASPYLEYFKKRVLAGIEISALDIGESETSNRSTSESLSRILIDGVTYLQSRIEDYFDTFIIKPLLLESSFSDDEVLDPDNMVHLKFKEIDIDSMIKMQNHSQQLYSAHGITEPEYRRSLGLEPLTEEERFETYWKLIQEPIELIRAKQSGFSAEAEALADNPQSAITEEGIALEQKAEKEALKQKQAAKKTSGSQASSTGGERSIKSRNRPSNQHGTKLGSNGRKSSEENPLEFLFEDSQDSANPINFPSISNSISSFWSEAISHLKFLGAKIDSNSIHRLFGITLNAAKKPFQRILLTKVYEGIKDVFLEEGSTSSYFNVRIPSLFIKDIEEQIDSLILKLIRDVQIKAKETDRFSGLLPIDLIDTLSYRVKFIDGNEMSRAYTLGRALGLRQLGFKKIQVVPLVDTTCDQCKIITNLDLNNISYTDMPPISHPNAKQIVKPLR